MIFGIKEKCIIVTQCIVGYCYKYSCAAHDCVCAPGTRLKYLTKSSELMPPAIYIIIYLKKKKCCYRRSNTESKHIPDGYNWITSFPGTEAETDWKSSWITPRWYFTTKSRHLLLWQLFPGGGGRYTSDGIQKHYEFLLGFRCLWWFIRANHEYKPTRQRTSFRDHSVSRSDFHGPSSSSSSVQCSSSQASTCWWGASAAGSWMESPSVGNRVSLGDTPVYTLRRTPGPDNWEQNTNRFR